MEQTQTTKHTPGPWTTDPRYDDQPVQEVYGANGSIVACVYSGGVIDTHPDRPHGCAATTTNRRLITSAPALLAALKALVEAFDGNVDCTDILDMIGGANSSLRAAIAAAEGGAA